MTQIPLPENLTDSFVGLGAYMNVASDGWFWIAMLLAILVICIISLMDYGFFRASTSSLFFVTVLTIILRFLGYVGDQILITFIILLAASAFIMLIFEGE